MLKDHKVRQGECISSIAFVYGFFPDTIWNDPANAELKQKRKDPNVLFPGDTVYIPTRRLKEEPGGTGQKHRFRRKGVPAKFRLRLLLNDEPRMSEPYILDIDGILFSGTTDVNGWIESPILPNAKKGKLLLDNGREEYPLELGNLDPVGEITGVQVRLYHLGFYIGDIDGVMNPETADALRAFQKKQGLEETGQPESPLSLP